MSKNGRFLFNKWKVFPANLLVCKDSFATLSMSIHSMDEDLNQYYGTLLHIYGHHCYASASTSTSINFLFNIKRASRFIRFKCVNARTNFL